uniref:Tudor domain-containing protein 3-like n=1 Tax=Petromyzon marinus TaxID=7757 RepID=A0AAJ7WJT6_PETMA|nr:tudor domain-containing protein 3-like [Petromyzon marinus]
MRVSLSACPQVRTFGGVGSAGGNLLSGGSHASRPPRNPTGRQQQQQQREERGARSDARADGIYRELVDERSLLRIMEMGFTRAESRAALMDHHNRLEDALNALLLAPAAPPLAELLAPQPPSRGGERESLKHICFTKNHNEFKTFVPGN